MLTAIGEDLYYFFLELYITALKNDILDYRSPDSMIKDILRTIRENPCDENLLEYFRKKNKELYRAFKSYC